jgi:tetratricopeptide (TPR) repeat protein
VIGPLRGLRRAALIAGLAALASGCAQLPAARGDASRAQAPPSPRIVPHLRVGHSAGPVEGRVALGRHHLADDRPDAALEAFSQALRADPAHVGARHGRAIALAERCELDAAEDALSRLLDAHPDAPHAAANLARLRSLRGAGPCGAGAPQHPSPAAAAAPPAATAQPPAVVAYGGSLPVLVRERVGVIDIAYGAPAPVARPSPDPAPTIEVLNGNGVPGMARRVGARLERRGLHVARVADAAGFGVQRTVIQFAPQARAVATRIARMLPGPVRLEAQDRAATQPGITIVLGRDQARHDAAARPARAARPAPVSAPSART